MSSDRSQCDVSVQATPTGDVAIDVATAWMRLSVAVAGYAAGRIVLHVLAMAGDRCVRFHCAGIVRELRLLVAAPSLFSRAQRYLLGALASYLVQPVQNPQSTSGVDPQTLASVLKRGDVLLSDGNTRLSSLVKRVTRSPWSHVSLYVGPLEDGPDPRCVVEADVAAGVRSIRLSELNALQVRVLRPIGLDDAAGGQLTTWVMSRIGCKYDLAHAWAICRKLVLPLRLRSVPDTVVFGARRFICCSLVVQAFALVGFSMSPQAERSRLNTAGDQRCLTPGDFERVPVFQVIHG